MRRWIIVGAGVIIVFVILAMLRPFRDRSGNNQDTELQTVVVTRGSLMATVGATGVVEANQGAILNIL